MRISEKATSNVAVLALACSLAAVIMSAYSIWLEPARTRLRVQEIQAQVELMKATTEASNAALELARPMGQIAEMWQHERDRQEKQRILNEQNRGR